jgi:hypothetical protein
MQGRAIPGTLCFPGTSLTAVVPPISLPAYRPAVFSPESQIPGDFIDDSEVLTKKQLAETPAASNWIHRRPMHIYKPTIRKFVLVWTQHVPVPPKKLTSSRAVCRRWLPFRWISYPLSAYCQSRSVRIFTGPINQDSLGSTPAVPTQFVVAVASGHFHTRRYSAIPPV